MDESELEVDAYGTVIKEGAWVKLLEVSSGLYQVKESEQGTAIAPNGKQHKIK